MIDSAIIVKRAIDLAVMPPGGPLLLAGIGLVLMRWRPRAGKLLASLGVVIALVLSTGATGAFLSDMLEGDLVGLRPEALSAAMKGPNPPRAVVILSGGSDYDRREYPGPDTLLGRSLIRVLQGARIARESGLPVLVTGGAVVSDKPAEAVVMARFLRDDFAITPKWVESGSLDTAENAANSAKVMRGAGIDSVVLVTDALHMRRSIKAFESAGLEVLPAPIGFSGAEGGDTTFAWLPSIMGASRVWAATHELVGLWWYQWRQPVAAIIDHPRVKVQASVSEVGAKVPD